MAEHATFHEPIELLSQAIMERHRAIVSLMEELEAVDWYDQRVEATTDDGIARRSSRTTATRRRSTRR